MAKILGLEIRINKMRTDMVKEIFEKARQSIARDIEWIPENPRFSRSRTSGHAPFSPGRNRALTFR